MPICYTVDHEQALLTTVASGRITLEVIRTHLLEKERMGAQGYYELVDARTVEIGFGPGDVRAAVDIFREIGRRQRPAPIAFVVSSDVAYGVTRMFTFLAEGLGLIEIFRNLEEARGWLESCRGKLFNP